MQEPTTLHAQLMFLSRMLKSSTSMSICLSLFTLNLSLLASMSTLPLTLPRYVHTLVCTYVQTPTIQICSYTVHFKHLSIISPVLLSQPINLFFLFLTKKVDSSKLLLFCPLLHLLFPTHSLTISICFIHHAFVYFCAPLSLSLRNRERVKGEYADVVEE